MSTSWWRWKSLRGYRRKWHAVHIHSKLSACRRQRFSKSLGAITLPPGEKVHEDRICKNCVHVLADSIIEEIKVKVSNK